MTKITELEIIAIRAKTALHKVGVGTAMTIEGWLEFGEALNEGREMFPIGGQGNKDFGQWKHDNELCDCRCTKCDKNLLTQVESTLYYMDVQAAMWAASNPDEFEEMRLEYPYPQVRTVRGWHKKWKDQNKPKPVAANDPATKPTSQSKPKASPKKVTPPAATDDDIPVAEPVRPKRKAAPKRAPDDPRVLKSIEEVEKWDKDMKRNVAKLSELFGIYKVNYDEWFDYNPTHFMDPYYQALEAIQGLEIEVEGLKHFVREKKMGMANMKVIK